jgi:EamA domain-containing membrane protein RarD
VTKSPPLMTYLWVAASVVSLGCLGVLHKVADRRHCRASAISFLLFFWAAAVVGLGYTVFVHVHPQSEAVPHLVMLVAAFCGTCAALAILSFQAGVRYGTIATSWLIINLSTAIPTVLSIMIYHEKVGLRRGFSLLLAVVALVFLWWDWRNKAGRSTVPDAGARELGGGGGTI